MRKKIKKKIIPIEEYPIIKHSEIRIKGSFKLNPWTFKGQTFRIVGYDIEKDLHDVLCLETRDFKQKKSSWLVAVSKLKC